MLKQFKDVLEIKNGRNQKAVENPNGQYPIYGSGGVMGYADDYICEANTIIIGRKGSINNPIFVDKPFWNVDTAFGLVPNIDIILPRYLFYFCKNFNFEKLNTTVTIPSLTKENLLKIEIEIPKLEKQMYVVRKLQKIESIIEKRKYQLMELDTLVKARFSELFIGKGYPTKTVDEVSLGKGEYGAQSASVEYDPSRPRYVRITDINDDGTLNNDVVASINPADDAQYKLEYGDFMFARMGATVGKTYAFIEGNQIFAGYLIRYRLNREIINPRYLFWYTRLDEYWNWVKLNQSGAAQPGINAKKYSSLQILLPPIKEQNAFAAFVAQVEKSKVVVQKSLDETQVLFNSLMQEYFG
jgi:type I restriction enzyme, S subunit